MIAETSKTSFFSGVNNMLKITNKRTRSVQIAVDSLFSLLLPHLAPLLRDELCLSCIKEIDNAEPIMPNDNDVPIFKTPFGLITPNELSSGSKSFILIMYRKQHPELDWIPSIDSMGTNAKQFLFDHCGDLDFPLYCTVCGVRFYDTPCLDEDNKITTIGKLLSAEEDT